MNPKFCKLNSAGSGSGSGNSGEVKTLGDEPGIPELKRFTTTSMTTTSPVINESLTMASMQ